MSGALLTMNYSKLSEWLLDNDCPWDFQLDESSSYRCADPFEAEDLQECSLLFSDKEAA